MIRRRAACQLRLACAALPILLACTAPGAAQQPAVPGPIEGMKAGDALLAPAISPEGPVIILVSLWLQRAYVYRNGVPIAVTTVSTGKRGHATPTGLFTILQKDADHRSNLYDDAPMPFMQRLTWDGVALHGGVLPGYPASHGCIRLPKDFARWLFSITRVGATVIVTDSATVPEMAPFAAAPEEPLADDGSTDAPYSWTPARAPTGPVSLIVSGRDRRIVVLRNGRQIGSAPVTLDEPVTKTTAYVLRTIDAAGTHWLRLPLPGDTAAAAGEIEPTDRAKAHLPEGFRQSVLALLLPGATLLVTRDTLASSAAGVPVPLLDTAP
jgi:hypothetical protein